jgi:hypothetical protein
MLGFALPAFLAAPAFAQSSASFIQKWDVDHEGTLDLNEIYKAADAEFDKLDTNHDGTLDQKELGNRLTKAEFDAANPDKDGRLEKAEYHALVQKRFEAADSNKDGTLDQKELDSEAGRRLLQLLE